MAAPLVQEPLLSKEGVGYSFKRTPTLALLVKFALKAVMWVIFITWAAIIFLFPSDFMQTLYEKWIVATKGTVFGYAGKYGNCSGSETELKLNHNILFVFLTPGSIFLLFGAPILVIVFLGIIYITVFPREYHEHNKQKFSRFYLWTFPVIIDGPFGVVSAAELVGILLFSAYIFWALAAYVIGSERLISKLSLPSKEKIYFMLDLVGLRLGSIGQFCLAFLFLPIARGSILLRLIDVPFEHATRYHIWLGHVTMALFTLHGLFYILSWSLRDRLITELLQWKNIGVAHLPGVISLLAGLLMWVTSLYPVRKPYFELFFYTHQLYAVFVIFLALHVGDFIFTIASGGIFLFILDRFLRFCQSRTIVDVISAKCLPCGSIELTLLKPHNMRYNALSFIFLQVREISWLQWHPFSVSSSPLDGSLHLSVLVKVLGGWTDKLREIISTVTETPQKGLKFQQYSKITASVEGPYGHESAYHLMYENLILVAGGIGISPFLAILRDILHRIEEKKPCLPKNVLVVWAVKISNELSLLAMVDANSICPSFSDKLNLEIQIYVTQELAPALEDGNIFMSTSPSFLPVKDSNSISGLVGTGNNVWLGIYVAMSTVGFVILWYLMEVFYIKPFGISSWWFQGLLFIIYMIAGVLIFGGLVIFFWNRWESRISSHEKYSAVKDDGDSKLYNEPTVPMNTYQTNLISSATKQYGHRPNFQAIFGSILERWGNVDVGVMVCGPPGLQSSVAAECRSQNMRGRWDQPVFHFNSHSFDL